MPTNDPNYMRDYQQRRRLEKAVEKNNQAQVEVAGGISVTENIPPENSPEHVTKKSHIDPAEIPQRASRYNCGCEPELLCTSHAIAKLPQKYRDYLLERINVHKGKAAQK